jgi:hypothetical protein
MRDVVLLKRGQRPALGKTLLDGYIGCMSKAQATTTETIVRDSKSGRSVTVRGVGALKGHLTISKGVDLTKPIASQAMKDTKGRTAVSGKH